MKKIEQFDGLDYTLATITAGTSKNGVSLSDDGKPLENREFNIRLVAASLEAGGHTDTIATAESLPVFMNGVFGRFLASSMEVNGLKSQAGEAGAGASPAAESTGDSSTAE